MKAPSQNTKSTSTTVLPQNQQNNVDLLQTEAGQLYRSGGPQYYGGQTFAGPTAGELLSRDMASNYATGAGQDYVNQLRSGDQFWLDPKNIYNPQAVPGFRDSQQYITDQITNNLTRNILPQVQGGATAGGTLGGSRQGISEGLAIGETSRNIGGALSDMEMGLFDRGMNMYNAAAARAPMVYDLGLAGAEVLGQVGAAERADQQQAIDADMARFNFEQMAPYLNLQMLQGFTGTAGQYGGTTNSKGQVSQDSGNGPMQAVGTILTLLSLL